MRDRLVSRLETAHSARGNGRSAQPQFEHQEVRVGQRFAGTCLRVLAEIGEGGMGKVYRAYHEELRLEIALKVIHSHLRASPRSVKRMRNEWRSLACLKHPNVVRVLDAGFTPRRTPYLVMEWIDGMPLDRVLRAERLPVRRAVELYLELLSALTALHRVPILHRDIKPQNLMLRRDDALQLLDFGVAQVALLEEARLTRAGATVGTPGYMAPEQAEGRALDARADIYASSLVFYEMLTGVHPFARHKRRLSLIDAQLHEEPERVEVRAPGLPPEIGDLLQRCLAKDPSQRPPSAGAVARELRALVHLLPAARTIDVMPASERTTQVEYASRPAGEVRDQTGADLPYVQPGCMQLASLAEPMHLRDGGLPSRSWRSAGSAETAPLEPAPRVRAVRSKELSRPQVPDQAPDPAPARGPLRSRFGWLAAVVATCSFSFAYERRGGDEVGPEWKAGRQEDSIPDGAGGGEVQPGARHHNNKDIITRAERAPARFRAELPAAGVTSGAGALQPRVPLSLSEPVPPLVDPRVGALRRGESTPREANPTDPSKLEASPSGSYQDRSHIPGAQGNVSGAAGFQVPGEGAASGETSSPEQFRPSGPQQPAPARGGRARAGPERPDPLPGSGL